MDNKQAMEKMREAAARECDIQEKMNRDINSRNMGRWGQGIAQDCARAIRALKVEEVLK